MDKFDESLLIAADLSGLPLTRYKRNKPSNKGGFRKKNTDICPDWEACKQVECFLSSSHAPPSSPRHPRHPS